jgi:LysM repeat protein
MRQAAFWSGCVRGACGVLAATCVGLAVAGCSSTSRFDFPAFNLTGSDNGNADLAATAALPVPEESVYSSGGAADTRLARASLPPPSYTPRPSAAAYSPQPSRRVGAEQANYPSQGAPHAEPAVLRVSQVSGRRIKIAKGDTLSILARRYGVTVEAIMSANNLPDGRLDIGQVLIMPGVAGAKVAEAAPAPAQSTYEVQKGDTPHDIAEKLGVDERALIERNNLNPNNLRIGQVLVIPGKDSKPAVAAKETSQPASNATPNVRGVKTTTILAPGSTSLAEEEAQEAASADDKSGSKSDNTADKKQGEQAPATISCRRPIPCRATASAGR